MCVCMHVCVSACVCILKQVTLLHFLSMPGLGGSDLTVESHSLSEAATAAVPVGCTAGLDCGALSLSSLMSSTSPSPSSSMKAGN